MIIYSKKKRKNDQNMGKGTVTNGEIVKLSPSNEKRLAGFLVQKREVGFVCIRGRPERKRERKAAPQLTPEVD